MLVMGWDGPDSTEGARGSSGNERVAAGVQGARRTCLGLEGWRLVGEQ